VFDEADRMFDMGFGRWLTATCLPFQRSLSGVSFANVKFRTTVPYVSFLPSGVSFLPTERTGSTNR